MLCLHVHYVLHNTKGSTLYLLWGWATFWVDHLSEFVIIAVQIQYSSNNCLLKTFYPSCMYGTQTR